jgi:hypothetical protein
MSMVNFFNRYLAIGLAASGAGLVLLQWAPQLSAATSEEYSPNIKSEDFVQGVSHKYLSLKPGTKYTFESRDGSKSVRIEIEVNSETKQVMGVTATVVRDREYINGQLKEDTRDWYAQDKDGNVWYFGEHVQNYKNGKLKDSGGSWEAGVNGALPGIVMPKDPKVGDTYRQEYYKGKAEDMGTVQGVGNKLEVKAGKFDDCIKIRDWSKTESSWLEQEFKHYCAGAGFMVLEEKSLFGLSWLSMNEAELVEIKRD